MNKLTESASKVLKNNSFLMKGDCEIIPYKSGKHTKLIFKINGEIRNIEFYFSTSELKLIFDLIENL
ncbi:hypothetical protein [Mucilaginibacter sp.]|uniref:hypothetical protein n=1 Tax=Mucilaginibacter sp. TaxID=1882438 RepID=UPI0025F9D94D|nr:hypothetical protein [Mucilaginibacter sp.]